MAADKIADKRHDHEEAGCRAVEQVDGHHTGGDGHVKAGAENTEHAQRRQKAGVDTDEATDPAAERRADAAAFRQPEFQLPRRCQTGA